MSSSFAELALESGLADQPELEDLAAGWQGWGAQPDAWFAILHGELLAVVP